MDSNHKLLTGSYCTRQPPFVQGVACVFMCAVVMCVCVSHLFDTTVPVSHDVTPHAEILDVIFSLGPLVSSVLFCVCKNMKGIKAVHHSVNRLIKHQLSLRKCGLKVSMCVCISRTMMCVCLKVTVPCKRTGDTELNIATLWPAGLSI